MGTQFANGANSTLSSGITSTATSLTVASATGFSAGPVFRLQLTSATSGNNNVEIVWVTGVSGATFTVTRAAEAYNGVQTAYSWNAGDYVAQVYTAADVTIPSYDTTVLTKLSLAPLAYWKLNEAAGSTSAADSSGNGYTLTASGTYSFGNPGLVPTDSETCWQGDGSSGNLSTGSTDIPLSGTDPYTALAVVKITAVPSGYQGVMAWGSTEQYGFNTGSGGPPFYININEDGNGPPTGPIGLPHVYGISFDGHGVTGYLDGAAVAADAPTSSAAGVGPAAIGSLSSGAYSPFPVGRVAIFAGTLTPKDWALLMQAFTGV